MTRLFFTHFRTSFAHRTSSTLPVLATPSRKSAFVLVFLVDVFPNGYTLHAYSSVEIEENFPKLTTALFISSPPCFLTTALVARFASRKSFVSTRFNFGSTCDTKISSEIPPPSRHNRVNTDDDDDEDDDDANESSPASSSPSSAVVFSRFLDPSIALERARVLKFFLIREISFSRFCVMRFFPNSHSSKRHNTEKLTRALSSSSSSSSPGFLPRARFPSPTLPSGSLHDIARVCNKEQRVVLVGVSSFFFW